jgi:DNA-binding NtrC family response regulator
MQDWSDTADPTSGGREDGALRSECVVVGIVFHPDLARVGAVARFSLDEASGEGVAVGRQAPVFTSVAGAAVPIGDPCVSRHQATLRWSAKKRVFAIEPAKGARREVRVHGGDGADLGPAPREAPPGSLVVIGDRVALSVDCAPGAPTKHLDPWGHSPSIAALSARVITLAAARDTVLIEGETGAGKELVARRLHETSARRRDPFVVVNCAALPDALVESELFGHAAGAFSGAAHAKRGLFLSAGRGTIFLDEIGELPTAAQAKLLRALEQHAVRPVGEAHEQPFEARVVAATNRDLEAEVRAGRFREDLYARLEAPRVRVPPLRERRADIAPLFVQFLERRRASCPALDRLWRPADMRPPPVPLSFFLELLARDWPRNVRELDKLAAETAACNDHPGEFTAPPPPDSARSNARRGAARDGGERDDDARPEPRPDRERPTAEELADALAAHEHVQHRVARALGVSRTTLDKWMRELGLRRPKELSREEIARACAAHEGDLAAAARSLGVSARGLRLRMTELGVDGAK